MKKIISLIVLSAVIILGIYVVTTTNNSKGSTIGDAINFQDDSTQVNDNDAIKVVENFLKWYKINYNRVNSITLVDTNNNPYIVSIQGCNEYLKILEESGYVSNTYIDKWRKYFLKCADFLIGHPQTDGPPEGFEYDFILLTQEIEDTLNAIETIKIANVTQPNELNATVEVDIMPSFLLFRLSRNDQKWLIDDIE